MWLVFVLSLHVCVGEISLPLCMPGPLRLFPLTLMGCYQLINETSVKEYDYFVEDGDTFAVSRKGDLHVRTHISYKLTHARIGVVTS